jgi:hypothetical protein
MDSQEVKAKVGDFGFALAPENANGFLDRCVAVLVQNAALQGQYGGESFCRTLVEHAAGVTVVQVDWNLVLIALDPNRRFLTFLDDLQNTGIANFDQDVILDPVYSDFVTEKLLAALQAIGNPPVGGTNPLVQRATGLTGRGSRRSAHTPAADFLWNATVMANTAVARNLPRAVSDSSRTVLISARRSSARKPKSAARGGPTRRRSLRRSDVTSAPNASTPTHFGVYLRSAQRTSSCP